MPVAWRLSSAIRMETAFTGEGPRRTGGRWNLPGTPCVYTASSLSLASLEVMVHVGGGRPSIPYVSFRVDIPDDLVIGVLPEGLLIEGWTAVPSPSSLATFGSRWISNSEAAVLAGPSAVVPGESNFLLNPAHPDFAQVTISEPEPFTFDERLLLGHR